MSVPEKGRTSFFEAVANSPESSSPGGKHSPKALAFWKRKAALRKEPGRCTRCAKPNNNGHKQCDKCREWAAQYRARKVAEKRGVLVDRTTLEALERRIGNLEHYWAHVSLLGYVQYKRGYRAGQRIHKSAQERASYFDAFPRATAQELAEISHEFSR